MILKLFKTVCQSTKKTRLYLQLYFLIAKRGDRLGCVSFSACNRIRDSPPDCVCAFALIYGVLEDPCAFMATLLEECTYKNTVHPIRVLTSCLWISGHVT